MKILGLQNRKFDRFTRRVFKTLLQPNNETYDKIPIHDLLSNKNICYRIPNSPSIHSPLLSSSHYLIASLSHCLIVPLPHCPIASLPHSSIVTFPHPLPLFTSLIFKIRTSCNGRSRSAPLLVGVADMLSTTFNPFTTSPKIV